jgi:LPXTG-site transpeptidase (sortase) family protein
MLTTCIRFVRRRLALPLLLVALATPAAAHPASHSTPGAPPTYTVQPGDTLTAIAAKVGVPSWRDLYAVNREQIENPHLLQVGQVLRIPEVPVAVPPTVPPVAAAPTAASSVSAPVQLRIPTIGLDLPPVPVGLDANNMPIVPKHDVGWYTLSAMPGQGENVVFWGHVLRWQDSPGIPAPFADIKYLEPGAEIYLYTADGDEFRYAVTETVQVTPDQVEYVLPQGKEKVTLVSCIGDNVIVDGWLTKQYRLITIAEPVR